MSRVGFMVLIAVTVCVSAAPAQPAMYKWVDEHGGIHYGDRAPAQSADRASVQLKNSGRTVRTESRFSSPPSSAQDQEKAKVDTREQIERQRQDTALLATYANESEIEQARARELQRNADTLRHATAGLATAGSRDDKRKLDALLEHSRQEKDAINAKFDARLARYRELAGAQLGVQPARYASPAGR